VKLHIYDLVVIENKCFKFQLDRTHVLAARIIYLILIWVIFYFLNFFLNKAHLAVPEGGGVAAEM